MPRLNLHSISMQISRMFEQGQSMFCSIKVQDWLKQQKENPEEYNITFREQPAPPNSGLIKMMTIELSRKDGQPVDPWLQEEINRYT